MFNITHNNWFFFTSLYNTVDNSNYNRKPHDSYSTKKWNHAFMRKHDKPMFNVLTENSQLNYYDFNNTTSTQISNKPATVW